MNQPWGLSGPQFLGVYAGALAVSVLLLLTIRAVLRRGPVMVTAPLDVYTLAALGGGGRRVVDTAVYALIESGRLRASRDHKITVCGGAADEPVQQAVLSVIEPFKGTPMRHVRKMASAADPVRRISSAAVEHGLLLTPDRRRAANLTALLPLAVFGVGVARLVNGIRLGRPTGLLVLFMLITVVVVLVTAVTTPRRTRAGQQLFRPVNRQARSGEPLVTSYGPTGAVVPTAVLAVAVLGAAGVSDQALRTALFGSTASDSSSGGGCGGGGGGCGGGCGG